MAKMRGDERALFLAKGRDNSAVSTSKKKLLGSEQYQSATEAEQRRMVEDDKKYVLYKW